VAESIKSRLAAGKVVRIFAVGAVPNFKLIEIAAQSGGYHGVWIDQEHAALSQGQIEQLAVACRATGLDSYVRLAPTSYADVMRPMEAGVGGVMAAQVRSAAEVRQIVSWAKFPPLGCRGVNTSNFEGGYTTRSLAEFVRSTNQDRWLSIQIETAEALDQVEEIARVEGVDCLFVGPADLSVALGVPGEFLHAKCLAALERVSKAVQSVGKSWGILARGAEHARECQRLGCQFFAFASDLSVLQLGFRATHAMYQEFFADQ
jgi:2-dehydro-3-deoxyglucarate aldolase/4-hydroxy-2-oxoheptanedioate aldolase